jgi:hypothetical protein
MTSKCCWVTRDVEKLPNIVESYKTMLENVGQHQGNVKKMLNSAIIIVGGNNNNKWLCDTKKCHGTPKLK